MGCAICKDDHKVRISTAVEIVGEAEYKQDSENVQKSEVRVDGKLIKVYFRPFYTQKLRAKY